MVGGCPFCVWIADVSVWLLDNNLRTGLNSDGLWKLLVVETSSGRVLRALCSDNGGEYTSKKGLKIILKIITRILHKFTMAQRDLPRPDHFNFSSYNGLKGIIISIVGGNWELADEHSIMGGEISIMCVAQRAMKRQSSSCSARSLTRSAPKRRFL